MSCQQSFYQASLEGKIQSTGDLYPVVCVFLSIWEERGMKDGKDICQSLTFLNFEVQNYLHKD